MEKLLCLKAHVIRENIQYLTKFKWKLALSQVILHIALVYGLYLQLTFRVKILTIFWAFIVFAIGGIGTGVGAHRYFAHKAFSVTRGFKIFLAFAQTVSGLFSIHYWVRTHRIHHKFTDTDRDPTNINRGFFFAYAGYYFIPRHPHCQREWDRWDMSDVENDKDLMFQYNYYELLWSIFTIGLPTIIPYYLWSETLWVAFWMNLFRYGCNFGHLGLSNTLSHMYGMQPYDTRTSARENMFMNGYTFGEGYHNFHHTFPQDFRGSEYEDPFHFNQSTKLIKFFQKKGWIYNLKKTAPDAIWKRAKRCGDGSHLVSLTSEEKLSS